MTLHRTDTIEQDGRSPFLANPVGAVTDVLGTSTYAYDADDELTDQTDRDGRHTQYVYDGAGRRTQERWLDGSGATLRTISSTYDAVDQLTSVSDPDSTLTFSYDAAGQLLTAGTSSPGGQPSVTLTSAYDRAGRRKTLTDNLASVGQTSYTYDAANRLTSLSRTVGGTAGPKVEFGYDNADRLTSLRRTNGTTNGGGLEGGLEGGGGGGTAITTTIGSDAADRLTAMSHQVVGGPTLATYAYAYDAANRVSSETNAEGTVNYTYDVTNQLTGVSGSRSEAYGYDLAGNRNTTGYTTTTGNRMTASPGATYTYDAEGNRIGKLDTTTGHTTAYAYDYRNRLTGVTERNAGGTLLHQVTYTYDTLDRRIGVNTDGTQTWTVYNGQNPYADFNSAGALATRYLHGPAVDMLLARTSASGTTAWYLTDRLGSVRDIANTSGTVIDHIAYDSFGNVLSESSPANGDRFKYTAREWDAIAALQFNRARYYDPASGRWVSRDPIGFSAGDANLYRYVNHDPLNRVDPTGLDDEHILQAVWDPRSIKHDYPTAPAGKWTPIEFFGKGSPLIDRTSWGCGGLAAWRAGAPINPISGKYFPMDIQKIPGAMQYGTFLQAETKLTELGGKGKIIAIQNNLPDWKQSPGSGNFATYFGTYWEWANHGDATPGRMIIHRPTLPVVYNYTVYIVVPSK